MFFESRLSDLEASETYAEVAAAFVSGDVPTAVARAQALRGRPGPSAPEDFLLCIDLHRARGELPSAIALSRIGRRRFPHDPALTLAWARSLSHMDREPEALTVLEGVVGDDRWGQIAKAARAACFAALQREGSFDELAAGLGRSDDPRVAYELGYGALCLRRWDEAIAFAQRAKEGAPLWPRATVMLCEGLIARGRVDEVEAILQRWLAGPIEDATLSIYAAMIDLARLRWSDCADGLEAVWAHGPRPAQRWLATMIGLSRWMDGRVDEARAWADRAEGPLAKAMDGAHRGTSVVHNAPLLSQERSMCVPVATSLVAAVQGHPQDPVALYEAMHGHGGTTLWRMADVMAERGLTTHHLHARPEIVRRLLDAGVPLLGPLYGVLGHHVEVVCGYDEGLGLVFLRDPSAWMLQVVPEAALADRYAPYRGVVALLPKGREDLIEDDWRHDPFARLDAIDRAVAAGDVKTAQEAFEGGLSQGAWPGSLRMLAHQRAVGVACTPRALRSEEDAVLADASHDANVRLSVVLGRVGTGRTHQLLATVESMELTESPGLMRLLRVSAALEDCRWEQARSLLDLLLERGGSQPMLWRTKAALEEQTGDLDAAREAIGIAREIASDDLAIESQWRWLHATAERFEIREAELRARCERFPEREALWAERAHLLLTESGDGELVDEVLRRWGQRFPRSPMAWQARMEWYAGQDRDDLVDEVRQEALRWLDAEELMPSASSWQDTAPPQPEVGEALAAVWTDLRGEREEPFESWPAVAWLRQRSDAQRLGWRPTAQLAAMTFVAGLVAGDAEPELPETLPGVPTLAARAMLEQLEDVNVPPEQASRLLGWVHGFVPEPIDDRLLGWSLAGLERARGHLSAAQERLTEVVRLQPQSASCWARLGQLAEARGDLDTATEHHRRALAASPGHRESLTALVALAIRQGDAEEAWRRQCQLVRRYPFDSRLASELLRFDPERFDPERVRARLPEPMVSFFVARKALFAEDWERAAALLAEPVLDQLPEEPRRMRMAMRIHVARQRERLDEAVTLADAALESFADGPAFWRLRGELALQADDRESIDRCVEGSLAAGAFVADIGEQWLASRAPKLKAIRRMIEGAPQAQRADVATEWCAAVERQSPRWLIELLEWCSVHVPEAGALRRALASILDREGRTERAAEVAQALLDEHPDDPQSIELLAGVLELSDPGRAYRLYERAHVLTGNIRHRRGMGLTRGLSGDEEGARQILREVIEHDPIDSRALVNLWVFGEPLESLVDGLFGVIEAGAGAETSYLLVLAVLGARATGRTVPAAWLPQAKARFEAVLEHGGFRDERERLGKALVKWLRRIGDHDASMVSGRIAFRWRLLFWPGKAWIPAET